LLLLLCPLFCPLLLLLLLLLLCPLSVLLLLPQQPPLLFSFLPRRGLPLPGSFQSCINYNPALGTPAKSLEFD
jgi:hypothetical protein